jgi:hypothetical protein
MSYDLRILLIPCVRAFEEMTGFSCYTEQALLLVVR